jgi:branched-chain amino acid aminotransferase
MAVCVSIDGVLHDGPSARISVFDRGFLYGDSVYEVMRTAGSRLVDEAAHLERLGRSARALAIPAPAGAVWRTEAERALAAAGNPESYVRLVLTRGAGEVGLDPALATEPLRLVMVKPLTMPAPALYRSGARLAIVGVERTPREALDPTVKSGNYLNNIVALAEAKKRGADECLMTNHAGLVVEGSSSNLFLVERGELVTPALAGGLLDGVTRRRVMTLARARQIPVAETEVTPERVRRAEEVFITSSIRGVLPIAVVDDVTVGQGPGPLTEKVMAWYEEFLDGVRRGV